jgi:hypothetical protein
MIQRILNYFFPTPKTMLDLAKEKILSQTHAFNNGDRTDFNSDQFFVVGSLVPHKASQTFNSFNVMFDHDDETVAIKQDKTVLYFFNNKEEVKEIRKVLQELGAR